jgi:hypothetical protein
MSRTFRRLKAVLSNHSYPCGPYVFSTDDATIRELYRAIGDGSKGQWNPPGTFTHQTSTVKLRRYTRREIHRAMMRVDGWDGFTLPRKWPRPWWW